MRVPPVARSTPPTTNKALTALVKMEAEAVICLFVPASLHSTFVKVADPFAAAVPISNVVVPSNEPEPEFKASETLRLAAKPTVELLPKTSCDLTTGCVPSGEPVRDVPPGCVVKANRLTVAGLTTILPEMTLVRPGAVRLMVMVSATVYERL